MKSKHSPGLSGFDWKDPFLLEAQITPEERMARDTAAEFARSTLVPGVLDDFNNEVTNPDIFRRMGAAGFFGAPFPGKLRRFRCRLCRLRSYRPRVGKDRFRLSLHALSAIIAGDVSDLRLRQRKTKQKYLPKLAGGELIGCFALTEPEAGSDPIGLKTRAEKTNDGWRLSGEKTWISNSPIADVFIIWAKAEGKIRGFIVEKNTAGLSAPKITNKLSLRTSIIGGVVMDGVEVGEDALLPNAAGLKGPFGCLNRARFGICWGTMGAAEFCWMAAREYGLNRRQFGRPLAQNQLYQKKLADMQTEITLGLQGALRLGRLMDAGDAAPEMISLLKRNNCGKALDIARAARDMHGGNGISGEYQVMRHMVNLETVNTYEGTHDIHALILGRAQTGLTAF